MATIAQLADYEINGYWAWAGQSAHHFSNHTISYNLNGLTGNGDASLASAEKYLATLALQAWQDVANVTFVETSGAANITFTDAGAGRNASTSVSGVIDITTGWTEYYGTGVDSYSYQSYIHEIGHALGLGHTGPYNGTANYGYPGQPGASNIFVNDTLQYSIMSYFSQSNYDGASDRLVMTPQIADIYAVGLMYGEATDTRLGDTVYGWNATATAGFLYDFSNYSFTPAFTIYDSGGADSIDASLFTDDQNIDLTPGSFSSIGGLRNNIAIALNTVIEDAFGGDGRDNITGNDADNYLFGSFGDDNLYGGSGADTLYGGDGVDLLSGDAGNDVLRGESQNDHLDGGTGNDTLYGGNGADGFHDWSGDDNIYGEGGDDSFAIGPGADLIDGGDGIDTLHWSQAGHFSDEPLAKGLSINLATSIAVVNFDSGVYSQTVLNIENVEGLFYYSNTIVGDAHDNQISGGNQMDTLDGGDGNDIINAYAESDQVHGGIGNDKIDGGDGLDFIYGDAGDDYLFGGAGTDVVSGGDGNDIVAFDPNDPVVEGGSGTDVLQLLTFAVVDLTLDNEVPSTFGFVGNFEGVDYSLLAGPVTASGTADRNIFIGTAAADTFDGLGGDDTLRGGGGGDTLRGGDGADILDGGGSADHMIGAAGNDSYYVDYAGDVVDEGSGPNGIDTVNGYISINLADTTHFIGNVDNVALRGPTNINATGNGLNNTLTGNSGNNILNGGGGADHMIGAAGNDTYYVDNASDVVDEGSGPNGIDTVNGYISINLADTVHFIGNVDNVALRGPTSINATGNGLNNTLTGNSGNNILNGGGGADTMSGAQANDTYFVDNAADHVIEVNGQGTDNVQSSVSFNMGGQELENLALRGPASINGTGNSIANVITGNSGNNVINGLGGNDTLSGSTGHDSFVFNSVLNASTNVDHVTDYSVVDDTIQLENAIFTALTTSGTLAAAAFHIGAVAATAAQHILYDSANGWLNYDADGNGAGAATHFATLTTGLAMTNTDFFVV